MANDHDLLDALDAVRDALREAGIEAGATLSAAGKGDFEIRFPDGKRAQVTLEMLR